ncbi:hypothetical protein J437_LFUL019419 [Ladona fulva]|uniref:PiggyBac transposable element-derived protein domain-containing protein n=1 Tax=Ladona fulva TaxID=123851 RepID=A0A8K0KXD5_LADFU|nr:hypothetical protein J437_LFUL019419 [Ladona fulva]
MSKKSLLEDSILEILTRSDSEDEEMNTDSDEDVFVSQPSTSEAPTKRRSPSISSGSEDSSDEEMEVRAKRKKTSSSGMDWFSCDLTPKIHLFDTTSSGCKADVSAISSISAIFKIFVSTELVSLISKETNRFYQFTMDRSAERILTSLQAWKDTTNEEMYRFLAITMLMPRTRKLALHEYWSRDALLKTPIFGELMSRDRYLTILRMLHFSDNNIPNSGDRLHKIRPVVDYLRATFRNTLVPFQNLCIDESLMLFKGRLFFKQYIPSKRNRFGVKIFVICDCETGYILDFIVYTGSDTKLSDTGKKDRLTGEIIKKPTCVVDYNRAMGAVDKADMMLTKLCDKTRLALLASHMRSSVWLIATCV